MWFCAVKKLPTWSIKSNRDAILSSLRLGKPAKPPFFGGHSMRWLPKTIVICPFNWTWQKSFLWGFVFSLIIGTVFEVILYAEPQNQILIGFAIGTLIAIVASLLFFGLDRIGWCSRLIGFNVASVANDFSLSIGVGLESIW